MDNRIEVSFDTHALVNVAFWIDKDTWKNMSEIERRAEAAKHIQAIAHTIDDGETIESSIGGRIYVQFVKEFPDGDMAEYDPDL